ncbi:hypothetical protein AB395_00006693 (plasmid) [Sinorhizobium fredii CCBAU 45436]|nr:hypothetical protein AB395_00006693 [Sinorhizobium fredii CCBAU 45436]
MMRIKDADRHASASGLGGGKWNEVHSIRGPAACFLKS